MHPSGTENYQRAMAITCSSAVTGHQCLKFVIGSESVAAYLGQTAKGELQPRHPLRLATTLILRGATKRTKTRKLQKRIKTASTCKAHLGNSEVSSICVLLIYRYAKHAFAVMPQTALSLLSRLPTIRLADFCLGLCSAFFPSFY